MKEKESEIYRESFELYVKGYRVEIKPGDDKEWESKRYGKNSD